MLILHPITGLSNELGQCGCLTPLKNILAISWTSVLLVEKTGVQ